MKSNSTPISGAGIVPAASSSRWLPAGDVDFFKLRSREALSERERLNLRDFGATVVQAGFSSGNRRLQAGATITVFAAHMRVRVGAGNDFNLMVDR